MPLQCQFAASLFTDARHMFMKFRQQEHYNGAVTATTRVVAYTHTVQAAPEEGITSPSNLRVFIDDTLGTQVVEIGNAESGSVELGTDLRRACRRREALLVSGNGLLTLLITVIVGWDASSSNCSAPAASHSSGTEPRLGGWLTGPAADDCRRRVTGSALSTTRSLDAPAEEGLLVAEAQRCRAKSHGFGDCARALRTVRRAVLELTDLTGTFAAEGLLVYAPPLATPRMLMRLGDAGPNEPLLQLTTGDGDETWTVDEKFRRLVDA